MDFNISFFVRTFPKALHLIQLSTYKSIHTLKMDILQVIEADLYWGLALAWWFVIVWKYRPLETYVYIGIVWIISWYIDIATNDDSPTMAL